MAAIENEFKKEALKIAVANTNHTYFNDSLPDYGALHASLHGSASAVDQEKLEMRVIQAEQNIADRLEQQVD